MVATTETVNAFARNAGFIAAQGIDLSGFEPLPGDASARRYYRLRRKELLLMEEKPGSRDLTQFVTISRYLKSIGLSAPEVYGVDYEKGLALIEDFGQQTFTRLLASGESERELYELAVDALVQLHENRHSPRPALPVYGFRPLTDELEMFTGWYVPACAPELDAGAFAERFLALWHEALSQIAQCRDVLVLRDYHVDNLMVIEGRSGAARCGLLDFQDGVLGSAAYDLVSLTQDARRDVSPELEEHLIGYYLEHRPSVAREKFLADYWLLAAHRHTKILGNFERLSKRDGKHGYLGFIARVQRQLAHAFEHADLGAIQDLMESALPGWDSHQPKLPGTTTDQQKVVVL